MNFADKFLPLSIAFKINRELGASELYILLISNVFLLELLNNEITRKHACSLDKI